MNKVAKFLPRISLSNVRARFKEKKSAVISIYKYIYVRWRSDVTVNVTSFRAAQ